MTIDDIKKLKIGDLITVSGYVVRYKGHLVIDKDITTFWKERKHIAEEVVIYTGYAYGSNGDYDYDDGFIWNHVESVFLIKTKKRASSAETKHTLSQIKGVTRGRKD